MKNKKKNSLFNKILFILLSLIVLALIVFVVVSKIYLSPVDSKNDSPIDFIVEKGASKNAIAEKLEKEGLIKSALFFKFYIKFNSSKELYAGTYTLTKSMDINEIIDVLNSNKSKENESITLTFIEGKRLTDYAKRIADFLNKNNEEQITADEIVKYIDSKEYVDKQIEKYWFITDKVLNKDIYHPLEGYLFADTYEFRKNATLDEILDKLLSTMDSKLTIYKEEIDVSSLSVHELLTLASIIELEGASSSDRAGVAGVFYNRIKNNDSLGSDATTYYGVNKDFSRDLSRSNLSACNGYNTRAESSCPIKGLPVGPICTPSLSSINAVIEPTVHDYYYFVADKNKKTYFSKTYAEHTKTVSNLKKEGLWYEY